MNIDFGLSSLNAKSIFGSANSAFQGKMDKLKSDGTITANKIGDVVENIALTEEVLYVLDGGAEMNTIKLQKQRMLTEGVMEVEKTKVRKGVV